MENEKKYQSSSLSSALRVFAVFIIIVGIIIGVQEAMISSAMLILCIGGAITVALIMFGMARALDYLAELVEIAKNDKK